MLQCTKEAYLREVECGTWNEAIEALPDYSREDILTQYRVQKGKKLPDKFQVMWNIKDRLYFVHDDICVLLCIYMQMFCKKAKAAKQHSSTPASVAQKVCFGQQNICVVTATDETLVNGDFGATNFVVIDFKRVCTVTYWTFHWGKKLVYIFMWMCKNLAADCEPMLTSCTVCLGAVKTECWKDHSCTLSLFTLTLAAGYSKYHEWTNNKWCWVGVHS